MDTDFRPSPGQVALVERPGAAEQVTGLVGASDADRVEIDLGMSNAASDGGEVVVSVCAPDALYRLRATSVPGRDKGILVLTQIHELERIQRRTARRVRIRVGVALACFDESVGELRTISGFTVDLGVGGVQLQTLRPLPPGDPTVLLTLPDGATVSAQAIVLQTMRDGDVYRSRLAFQDLDADAMKALSALVEAAPQG
jgi:c-di-GMP-binding flagellar brake protein YcgR